MMRNPVLWLELRIRIRERKLWIVTCLYLLCLFVISSIAVTTAVSRGVATDPADTGMIIYGYGVFSLLGLLVILGPLTSAGSISQEREQRTLPALLNTPMSPTTIVAGKLLAAWAFILWLALLSLPFLGLGVVWGAIALSRMLEGFGLAIAAGLVSSTIAVGLSGYFRRSLTSYLTTGVVMFLWLVVWPIFGTLVMSLLRSQKDPADEYPVILYLFYFHHPIAPLVAVMLAASRENLPFWIVPFALAVWTIIGVTFFAIARHGLRRRTVSKS